jgi:hypothetical protein
LIIIGALFVLGILFFLFILWAISKGLRNKFGPEWLPAELKIDFNYINVSNENRKTIRYVLSEHESNAILKQISSLITNNSEAINSSFDFEFQKFYRIPVDDETYAYRQIESQKLKAVFSVKNKELIYYK